MSTDKSEAQNKSISIRRYLVKVFLPLFFGLWITSAVVSFCFVFGFVQNMFDRDLANSADSVVGRLRVKDGKLVCDMPASALAMLRGSDNNRVFYSVTASSGKLLFGDGSIAFPSEQERAGELKLDEPRVFDWRLKDKELRVVEVKVDVDEYTENGEPAPLVVRLAETVEYRRHFQENMLLGIAVPQFFVIALALAAAYRGTGIILRPLSELQAQLARRSPGDLAPVSRSGMPEEVQPLIEAINGLLLRLEEDINMKRRFISNAAHQLRTPLAGLKTYSSLGLDLYDADELRDIVRQLDSGIDRASRMVNQLLGLARANRSSDLALIDKKDVDLKELIYDVKRELEPLAGNRKIEISHQFDSDIEDSKVKGDPVGLRNLLVNLIENALIYSPQGTKVTVALERGKGADANKLVLNVIDQGPGIEESEIEKVFERFYRARGAPGNGSGLGLAIVKEVLDSVGGTIEVLNNPLPQNGLTMRVVF